MISYTIRLWLSCGGITTSRFAERSKKITREIQHVVNEVHHEVSTKTMQGETFDLAYLHLRLHEKLYEKRHGHPPASSTKIHPSMCLPTTDEGCQSENALGKVFGNDLWPIKQPRPMFPNNPDQELVDASDEYACFENEYIHFLRSHSLKRRKKLLHLRTLWLALSQRLLQSEQRYLVARNKMMGTGSVEIEIYAESEERVRTVRQLYTETFKSMRGDGWFDPGEIHGTITRQYLQMSEEDFRHSRDLMKQKQILTTTKFIK